MRDKLLSLVLCGLLAVTLFACGEKRGVANDSDILGDESRYTNDSNRSSSNTTNGTNDNSRGNNNVKDGSGSGSMNGSTGNNARQSDVMGDSAMRGNTLNPANGEADRTATWEQMLQNGRVHDRDGFLFDGENSHWT